MQWIARSYYHVPKHIPLQKKFSTIGHQCQKLRKLGQSWFELTNCKTQNEQT